MGPFSKLAQDLAMCDICKYQIVCHTKVRSIKYIVFDSGQVKGRKLYEYSTVAW